MIIKEKPAVAHACYQGKIRHRISFFTHMPIKLHVGGAALDLTTTSGNSVKIIVAATTIIAVVFPMI
jgi:hypothetical protein